MSDRREITIGALRLTYEPDAAMAGSGIVRVRIRGIDSTGDDIGRVHLYPAEVQSLLAVSALIEAAREWRETMDWSASRAHQEQFTCEVTLVDAIDALTATSSRGSK